MLQLLLFIRFTLSSWNTIKNSKFSSSSNSIKRSIIVRNLTKCDFSRSFNCYLSYAFFYHVIINNTTFHCVNLLVEAITSGDIDAKRGVSVNAWICHHHHHYRHWRDLTRRTENNKTSIDDDEPNFPLRINIFMLAEQIFDWYSIIINLLFLASFYLCSRPRFFPLTLIVPLIFIHRLIYWCFKNLLRPFSTSQLLFYCFFLSFLFFISTFFFYFLFVITERSPKRPNEKGRMWNAEQCWQFCGSYWFSLRLPSSLFSHFSKVLFSEFFVPFVSSS